MKSAFIVRAFGVKHDARGKEIDFDRVQQDLIEPAMQRAGLRGDTTAEIARAGNIRADMFELLAKADLAIADVSIHNANVFYELGVRQALRDKRTFLIRCQVDEITFDLKTDRYLTYDRTCPEMAVDSLAVGLAETLAGSAVDSPIFQMVPQLEPQDWTRLMTLPPDFREEVEIAAGDRRLGDLELLSVEARDFGWAAEDLPMSASPRVVLFTGHRIDAPDRQTPRFPPVREARARQAIKDALVEEQQRAEDGIVGLAGGASGGDILFHEICAELQIESQLLLASPGDSYIDRSVRVAGAPDWVERFRKIEKHAKPRLLCKEGRLPSWLAKREENYVWVRNNLWTLYNALAHGGSNVTLIALWNGETGDGPGGTAHMVQEAKARGAKVVILDTRALFDL